MQWAAGRGPGPGFDMGAPGRQKALWIMVPPMAEVDLAPETLAALSGGEWHLLCEAEAEGAVLHPLPFPTEAGPIALAFQSEADLAAFTEKPAAYAALPGRALVAALAEAGLGLGLDFGQAQAALLPASALKALRALWAAPLPQSPESPPLPQTLTAPPPLPAPALQRLAALLGQGLPPKAAAYLFGQALGEGTPLPGLALLGAPPTAEAALSRLAREAWQMAGLPPGPLALVLLAPGHPEAAAYRQNGAFLAEGAPDPQPAPPPAAPKPPGFDPAAPPILRSRPQNPR